MCASKSTERAMLAQEEGRDLHGRVKFCPFCFTSCYFFIYVCGSGAVFTHIRGVCPLAHCGGLKRTFTKDTKVSESITLRHIPLDRLFHWMESHADSQQVQAILSLPSKHWGCRCTCDHTQPFMCMMGIWTYHLIVFLPSYLCNPT